MVESVKLFTFAVAFDPANIAAPGSSPVAKGEVLHEAMFYGAESAYTLQYREFGRKKYAADNAWLLDNRGFSVDQAAKAIDASGVPTHRWMS